MSRCVEPTANNVSALDQRIEPKELAKWNLFSSLDDHFLSRIKLAHVFGCNNNTTTGLLVTNEDEVFSVGNNNDGRLGIGSLSPVHTFHPVKVDALCGKSIIDFSCGGVGNHAHCFALTAIGTVYAWGHNFYGQLGLETSTLAPTVLNCLERKRIAQVSCGGYNTLALTSDGEVFGWGYNAFGQVGNGSTETQTLPMKLTGAIRSSKISGISCGVYHSVAVSESGEVYVWGYNNCGQLGVGSVANSTVPIKVNLQGIFIQKIICADNHTMALSNTGKLYTWGQNNNGQLGIGTTNNSLFPTQVQEIGRVVDIAATGFGNISMCQTHSKVFVWGSVKGRKLRRPTEVPSTSMLDAFCSYSDPQLTYSPMTPAPTGSISHSVNQSLQFAFNDEATSDVVFVVENKRIHAHKTILSLRSNYFCRMFAGNWEENRENIVTIDEGTSYSSFHALLYYLYTDRIGIDIGDFENIIDLLQLADCYCEAALSRAIESVLSRSITTANVLSMYSLATKYNVKDLEQSSFQFILDNIKEIALSNQFSSCDLGVDDFKKIILELANQGLLIS